jgi:OmpA-OmpF porin, OOP family
MFSWPYLHLETSSLRRSVVIVAAICAAQTPAPARAQGGLIGRMKQKIQDKADATTDSLADLTIDKATGAVQCAATNSACIKRAFGAGKSVKLVDKNGKPISATDSAKVVNAAGGVPANVTAASAPSTDAPTSSSSTSAASPSPSVFGSDVLVNYDFVPGDRVIFAEDFSKDNLGDFPKRLELRHGNFEVAETKGQRFLRTVDWGQVVVPLPEVLPSRFTFEADYDGSTGWSIEVFFADPDSGDFTHGEFSPQNGGLIGEVGSTSAIPDDALKPVSHIAVMADGKYVKAYINGVRVANVPNAAIGRGKVIVLTMVGSQDTPAYLTNIRVAAGGKPLYDALMADGRVATHGILFDTGSDRIRAESKPTLDMIGQMLESHADLKLTIEGHTDNMGAAASNQTLSEKRSAAVRQFLISNYHVDAARLVSKGLGATKPARPNDTAEGRQQNRRVELVKM